MVYLPRYADYPDHLKPLYARDGNISAPVTESKTIPPGHGSNEFDITEIDGVIIAKFSFIQVRGVNLVTTGAGTGVNLGMRLSTDGGTTWIDGASDYRSIRYDAGVTSFVDDNFMFLYGGTGPWDSVVLIKNLNASMPTTITAQEITVGDLIPSRRDGMTLNSAVEHNAIQYYVDSDGGTVLFDGGTLDLVGYR